MYYSRAISLLLSRFAIHAVAATCSGQHFASHRRRTHIYTYDTHTHARAQDRTRPLSAVTGRLQSPRSSLASVFARRHCQVRNAREIFPYNSDEHFATKKRAMTDPFILERPIICPYDSNHSIAASRIQKHLVKCARNFPPDYKVSCPYNATHRLFKSEVQEHISSCPDHQHLDPTIYEQFQKRGAAMSSVASDCQSAVDCQESWDDDDESLFYPLPRTPNCLSGGAFDAVRNSSFYDNARRTNDMLLSVRNRAPRGLAEALMVESSGGSTVGDIESVTSFMGVGRAKPWNQPRNEIVRKVGRGRGSAQAQSEI